MQTRRALLYMPGHDRHKIEKATRLGVDCLCMDMEDGVAPARKAEARLAIAAALAELDFGSAEKLARINPVGSGLEAEDLAAVLPGHPDGIVVPKVERRAQVQWAAERIEAAELEHGWPVGSIHLLAGVESARAILALAEIAAEPRLTALIFGGEDLAADLAAPRSREAWEVFTARSLVVLHARAAGRQAIDMVTVDYRDLERVRREAAFGAGLGFDGKQVIHPAQVEPVQQAFTPDEAEVRRARELLEAFAAREREGQGAFGLDGRMVDLPILRAAENVLARAQAAVRR